MKIVTEKSILNVSAEGVGAFDVRPGVVIQQIANDGVRHTLAMTPNEAVAIGVTLIQGAAQAAALLAEAQASGLLDANGAPVAAHGAGPRLVKS